jgi:hypothetical protein
MRYFRAAVLSAPHRTLLPVFLIILCPILLSAQFASTPQQQTAARYVLTGTVVNSATGAGIPWALVQVDQSAKLADQNGNFHFDNVISTTVNLQAHKPGFFQENEINETHVSNMVTLSSSSTNVVLRLVPEAVISGHVENPEGEPLDGLPVQLRFAQLVNGRRMWQQQGNRPTDEDGNFHIANLKPGTYFVEVGPNTRARPLAQQGKSEVIPALYYPGVRELSAASPLRLLAGQRANLEFTTKRVPAYRVSGAVTGMTGNNGGLTLLDQDGESTNVAIRMDPRTGRFEAFPIPAGTYRLRFNGRDADGTELYADVPLTVNGDLAELRIPIERTMTVPVEYQTEFSKPDNTLSAGIGGGDTSFRNRRGRAAQLRLISRKPPYRQFWASSRAAGEVEAFRGLEAGTYDVEVESVGAGYVSSVTCGGKDLLREPLVLAEGSDSQSIQVTARDDGASVSGSVQIGNESQFAQGLMIDEDEGGIPPRPFSVNSSGTFQVQGLAPGRYDILAFDRLDGIEYRNREVLGEYLSHAAHVTLSADEQAKVTLDLIHTRDTKE